MRATALALDEGGEEEDEEEEKEEEQTGVAGHLTARRPVMHPKRTTGLPRPTFRVTCLISLLLLCFFTIGNASPVHPLPPHRGITHGSYIRYYEAASYDTVALRQHRNRMRRDVSATIDGQPLLLHLRALDK